MPVDLLETLLITAEQALWDREWTARDRNLPVPESVMRRGGYSKSAGITEKLTADRPATRRGDITRTETIMMKKETLNTLILRHGDRMLRRWLSFSEDGCTERQKPTAL